MSRFAATGNVFHLISCFSSPKDEYDNLRSQVATSSTTSGHGGRRHLPLVFAKRLDALETRLAGHDENFHIVFQALKQMIQEEDKPKRKIGF